MAMAVVSVEEFHRCGSRKARFSAKNQHSQRKNQSMNVKYRFILQISILYFFMGDTYTNIDIDAQYQEIYTDILVLSVFFSIIMKPFKNIFFLFIQILKTLFCFVYLLKRTTPCLFIVVIDLYWKGMACHACLHVVNYYHSIQKCHFL